MVHALLITFTWRTASLDTSIAVGVDCALVIGLTVATARIDADLTGQTLGVDVAVLRRWNTPTSLAGVVGWAVLGDAALRRMTECVQADLSRLTFTIDGARSARLAAALSTTLFESTVGVPLADKGRALSFSALVPALAVIIFDTLGRDGDAVPILTAFTLGALVVSGAHGLGRHTDHLQTDLAAATVEVGHARARRVFHATAV